MLTAKHGASVLFVVYLAGYCSLCHSHCVLFSARHPTEMLVTNPKSHHREWYKRSLIQTALFAHSLAHAFVCHCLQKFCANTINVQYLNICPLVSLFYQFNLYAILESQICPIRLMLSMVPILCLRDAFQICTLVDRVMNSLKAIKHMTWKMMYSMCFLGFNFVLILCFDCSLYNKT